MPYPLQTGRPIYLRRLMQLRINTGQRRQINDRAPSHRLPDAGPDIDRLEPAGLGHEEDRITAEQLDHLVDQPCGRGQEDQDHPDEHNGGQEVRCISNRLHEPFEMFLPHLVDHQRQNNRSREPYCQLIQADADRILNQAPKEIAVEKPLEMIESDPGASPNSLSGNKIFERNLQSVHRNVLEDNKIRDCGRNQDIQLPVPPVGLKRLGQPGRPVKQRTFLQGRFRQQQTPLLYSSLQADKGLIKDSFLTINFITIYLCLLLCIVLYFRDDAQINQ